MDGWPTPQAVASAMAVLPAFAEYPQYGAEEDEVRAALEAAGLPELWGVTQAAAELKVATGNLGKITNMPEPLYDLPQGRFWSADAIRALAVARQEERRARSAAVAE